jgi:PD-(D/E)XK endonuclease
MEHPKAKGDRTTLAVMLALREAGYAVLVPFGENTRCDLDYRR